MPALVVVVLVSVSVVVMIVVRLQPNPPRGFGCYLTTTLLNPLGGFDCVGVCVPMVCDLQVMNRARPRRNAARAL